MRRTLLIVDDHAGFRSFARALMEAACFDVIGEAQDGESALAVARRLRPEVVLLDVALPDCDGAPPVRPAHCAWRRTSDCDDVES